MKDTDQIYFNVPIQLYAGFMNESKFCLSNIFDYAIYEHSTKLSGTETERFSASCDWFNATVKNQSRSIQNGKELLKNTPLNSPKVGISNTIWFDYYKNEKTDFEKVCLLGFLAIKSILGNGNKQKPYWKLDNKFWLSRMDGLVESVSEIWELSDNIQIYASEYQTVKIKKELRNNWGLVTYSRFTRGFYVSFNLTLEQLVYEAEKRRKSTIEKQYQQKEMQAIKAAFMRLSVSKN